MKQRFLLTISLICAFLFSIVLLRTVESQTTTNGLITQKLTDPNTTVYDVIYHEHPMVAAGQNSAHIIWTEHITYPNPPDFDPDKDLFYANLPQGQVKQLKATSGGVTFNRIALDSSDNAYVVWAEDTKTSEGSDLFYWTTGMTTPQNLSDSAISEGDVGTVLIVIDDNDLPHVLWAEATNAFSFNPAIFYWTEGENTIKLSVGGLTMGNFNVTNAIGLATKSGVVHALWKDLDTSTAGGAEPYYWDSTTQLVVNLRDGLSGSEGSVSDYFLGKDGVFYVLWLDDLASPTYTQDYRLWDSASKQNHFIVNSSSMTGTPQLSRDGNGNAHLLWGESGTVYHWDSLNQTNQVVKLGDIPSYANGKNGNHIHLFWAAEDTNWPGHLEDLFYWRTDMSQPVNVTDHTRVASDASDIRLIVDETDTTHIVWNESGYSYYNSMDDVTQEITGTISLTQGYSWPGPIQDDVAEFGDIFTARAGIAYLLFAADNTNTTTPYSVWQSDTNSLIPVTAVYGPTDPASRMMWLDSDNRVHVAWEDSSLSGEGSNLHYWNATIGSQDLTDNDKTDREIVSGETRGLADASGNVYLAWTEFFDGETDMYAAYTPTEYVYIYLPAVLK